MIGAVPIPVEVSRVVREFRRRLEGRFGSALYDIRLFGSYARGTAHEGSDIDVFVLLDELDYPRQRDVLNIAGDLFAETNLLLSPTVFGFATYSQHLEQERPLAREIHQQGIGQ
jgi:predicted nucleotidyltransferase